MELVGRDALLADAAARARRYVLEADRRRVGPSPEAVDALGRFDFPFPERGIDAGMVLGRIRTADLPDPTPPAVVCLQAGNVNSGASDPFGR